MTNEPKMVRKFVKDYDLDMMLAKDFVEFANDILKQHGEDAEIYSGDEGLIEVYINRLETEQELARRLENERRSKEWERNNYLRLKAIYEPDTAKTVSNVFIQTNNTPLDKSD